VEPWSARDENRYFTGSRSRNASRSIWLVVLVVALLAIAIGAYYFYFVSTHLAEPAPAAPPAPPPQAEQPAPQAESPAPAIEHPVEAPKAAPGQIVPPLPALRDSDPAAREALIGLFGAKTFASYFYPERLILRIVATVDNLPRHAAPARMMPVKPVDGRFAVAGSGDQAAIDPRNAARYAPYVRIAKAINARKLVEVYSRYYPLFQEAYRQLGFPNGYFNDRLITCIDDLLAAPELDGPVKLAQPKVLYEYADPDLEARSAGQKIMMRIGRDNELAIKIKLREIRRALTGR
jgi:Protein of unknown function (DUF3014)